MSRSSRVRRTNCCWRSMSTPYVGQVSRSLPHPSSARSPGVMTYG